MVETKCSTWHVQHVQCAAQGISGKKLTAAVGHSVGAVGENVPRSGTCLSLGHLENVFLLAIFYEQTSDF